MFRPTSVPRVVSVGNFDGVHRAHQEVVRHMAGARARVRRQSRGGDLRSASAAHPASRRRAQAAYAAAGQARTAGADGVDAVLVLPFTRDLSMMTRRGLRAPGVGEVPARTRSTRGLQLSLRAQGAGQRQDAGRVWASSAASRPSLFRSRCCAAITFPAARSAS